MAWFDRKLPLFLKCLGVWLAIASFCACETPASKTPPETPRSHEGSLLAKPGLAAFSLRGPTKAASLVPVIVQGQPFDRATRIETQTTSEQLQAPQLLAKTNGRVNQGDTLFVSFYVRAVSSSRSSGEVATEVVFEQSRPPHESSISHGLTVGSAWQLIQLPFVARGNYAPGEAQLLFRLGHAPQKLDLADVRLLNYGKSRTVAELPRTKLSYRGRDNNAPWRSEALDRIDAIRRGELELKVIDAKGKPVPGVKVTLRMRRHEFLFGTHIDSQRLLIASEEGDRYRASIKKWFNAASLKDGLKWKARAGDWNKTFDPELAGHALTWLRQNDLTTRGHVLVSPEWKHLPNRLQALKQDPVRLQEAIKLHVYQVVNQFRGQLSHWDVVNEPANSREVLDLLGPEKVVDWFREAKRADPSARLYIHDYSILAGSGDPARRHPFDHTIEALIAAGAPIDGIAFRGQFSGALPAPTELWAQFEHYARFDRALLLDQFEIAADDERLYADYMRDLLILTFSHPQMTGFFMSGGRHELHDSSHASPSTMANTPKPAAQEYRRLVFERWWSNLNGTTDSTGTYFGRGFRGEYDVLLEKGDKQKRRRLWLDRSSKNVTLELE